MQKVKIFIGLQKKVNKKTGAMQTEERGERYREGMRRYWEERGGEIMRAVSRGPQLAKIEEKKQNQLNTILGLESYTRQYKNNYESLTKKNMEYKHKNIKKSGNKVWKNQAVGQTYISRRLYKPSEEVIYRKQLKKERERQINTEQINIAISQKTRNNLLSH